MYPLVKSRSECFEYFSFLHDTMKKCGFHGVFFRTLTEISDWCSENLRFVDKSHKIVYNPCFEGSCCSIFVFYVVCCRSLFVLFRLVIVFLRHTASDYVWGIFKLFLSQKLYCDSHEDIWNSLLNNSTLDFPISHVTERRTTFKFPMLNSSLNALKKIPFFLIPYFINSVFWKI